MTNSHALWRSCVSALVVSLACAGPKDLQGLSQCRTEPGEVPQLTTVVDGKNKDLPTIQPATPEGTKAANFGGALVGPSQEAPAMIGPTKKKTKSSKPDSTLRPFKKKTELSQDDFHCCILPGKKDSGTASGPETLSNTQISTVISKANFASCKAIGTGKVQMKITISSSGSVTNAKSDGTALGECVARMSRRLKFPSISSPSQTFSYPVYSKE